MPKRAHRLEFLILTKSPNKVLKLHMYVPLDERWLYYNEEVEERYIRKKGQLKKFQFLVLYWSLRGFRLIYIQERNILQVTKDKDRWSLSPRLGSYPWLSGISLQYEHLQLEYDNCNCSITVKRKFICMSGSAERDATGCIPMYLCLFSRISRHITWEERHTHIYGRIYPHLIVLASPWWHL